MSEPIYIAARIRPQFITESEKQTCLQSEVKASKLVIKNSLTQKDFGFDFIFNEQSSQECIQQKVGALILDSFADGIQTSIFAYGRGKTGKTYTFFGKDSQKGLIPYAFTNIEKILRNFEHSLLTISCLYVINEEMYDLLNYQKTELKLERVPNLHVSGLEKKEIEKMEEIEGYLDYVNRKKTMLHSKLGKITNFSHTIFTVEVQTNSPCFRYSKMNFVEVSTPFDENRQIKLQGTSGKNNFNIPLNALHNVVHGLVDGSNSKIPYSDSILTQLMRKSLGGDCRTIFLFTFDPLLQNYKETMKLLKISQKIKKIENNPFPKVAEKTNLEIILEELENLKTKVLDPQTVYEEGESSARRENQLIYRNEFIPQNRERDLRLSQKMIKKKKKGEMKNQKMDKDRNWLEKKLLKLQKQKTDIKEIIKNKAKAQLNQIEEKRRQKDQEIFKKKDIIDIEKQFQLEREEYLENLRELEKKCSFYKQISENLLPKQWIKILQKNTEEEKGKCKVPHFRISDRRLELSKKPQMKGHGFQLKKMVLSPKARESGNKGKIQSSRKSVQFFSRSSQPKIRSEQKAFFAPYLTRKTFKTGFKQKEQESQYYQVIDQKKEKTYSNDLLYRSWSQKNLS